MNLEAIRARFLRLAGTQNTRHRLQVVGSDYKPAAVMPPDIWTRIDDFSVSKDGLLQDFMHALSVELQERGLPRLQQKDIEYIGDRIQANYERQREFEKSPSE